MEAIKRVFACLEPGYTPSPRWYTERVDLEEARREIGEIEDTIEDARVAADANREEADALQGDVEDLEAVIEARDATIKDLEARIATLEALTTGES